MVFAVKNKRGAGSEESSPPAISLRRGGLFLLVNCAFKESDFADILDNPDLCLDKSSILKDSRTTRAGVFAHGSLGGVFLKRYNNKGLWHTAKYLFRDSRAVRAFRSHLSFARIGIPVPEPVAAFERRVGGSALVASWLLTRHVAGTLPTLEYYSMLRDDASENSRFISVVCGFLARMHNSGFSHGDLKLSNIYATGAGGVLAYGFWDLDAARWHSSGMSEGRRAAELARFVSSYADLGGRTGREVSVGPLAEEVRAVYERASSCVLDGGVLERKISRFTS